MENNIIKFYSTNLKDIKRLFSDKQLTSSIYIDKFQKVRYCKVQLGDKILVFTKLDIMVSHIRKLTATGDEGFTIEINTTKGSYEGHNDNDTDKRGNNNQKIYN
jgi:hypothetical protein